MSIIRTLRDKNNPYLILNKTCINDNKLSWGARGVHTFLLGKPNDWKTYVSNLIKESPDGKTKLNNYIIELIDSGYINRKAKREGGQYRGYDYDIHEIPQQKHRSGNTEAVTPETVEQPLLSNNNKLNNKLNNKDKSSSKEKSSFMIIRDLYLKLYESKFYRKPAFSGIEGKAINNVLENYSIEEIIKCLNKYFLNNDKFVLSQGYTMRYFQTAISGLILEGSNFQQQSQNIKIDEAKKQMKLVEELENK